MQFIRSEINIVDFVMDNAAADVHILITSQGTGGGGSQYQFIFFGRQQYKNHSDTLRFTTSANATDFEQRDMMLKYLKAGMVPFIIRSATAKGIEINLKTGDSAKNTEPSTDRWRSWILRVGGDANISADANYKNRNYNLNFSANKITDDIKTGIGVNWNSNRSSFKYDDNGTLQGFVVNNRSWSVNQYLVKSINSHWSWA